MVHTSLMTLRHRPGGFVAAFVSLFLGAVVLMAFASLLDTAAAGGIPDASTETLVLMASVVGGCGSIVVVFAMASTLTLAVGQRRSEIALLKSVGATPAQVGRMVATEAAVLAVVAWLAAVVPAAALGRLVVHLLRDSGQVAETVSHDVGVVALAGGFAVTLVAALASAVIAARRTARVAAREAMTAAEVEPGRLSVGRRVAGGCFLALGLNNAVVTATVFNGEGIDAMQTAGQASIWFAVGLALLGPPLVRAGTAVFAGPLRRLGGPVGEAAVLNLRARSHQMASALTPIVLFTAIATGTLTMQAIENGAASPAGANASEERNIEILNLVVVGMVAVFAAIMLVNTLVAATTHRRREFGQLRLAGATPPEVVTLVALESAVLLAVGVVAGLVASTVTSVPYAIARTDTPVPDVGAGIAVGVVVVTVALTLASGLSTTRRTLGTPAVEAVAA